MKVILGSDLVGFNLKNYLKKYIFSLGYEVVDVTENPAIDFVDSTLKVARYLSINNDNLGIAIDEFGVGSFMVATKIKGMVVAEVSDERSAYMTREHNNSRMITIGSGIVGERLAENIVKEFLEASYAGGRHQIRVDMLNKMC